VPEKEPTRLFAMDDGLLLVAMLVDEFEGPRLLLVAADDVETFFVVEAAPATMGGPEVGDFIFVTW
jgi:hypothetical protein